MSTAQCVAQVETVAVAKHGSLEVVSQQKQQKVRDKIEDRAKRRQAAEQDERKCEAHKQQLTAVHQKYSEDVDVQEGGIRTAKHHPYVSLVY